MGLNFFVKKKNYLAFFLAKADGGGKCKIMCFFDKNDIIKNFKMTEVVDFAIQFLKIGHQLLQVLKLGPNYFVK